MSNDNAILGSDERLRKNAGDHARGNRSNADQSRTDKDGTAFDKAEKRSNFRDEWAATALPTPPEIPGYHLCWLSTTNTYDPIHKRIRMGYEPVSVSELKGFESYKMKSGEFEGTVSCNEMVLFKIPQEIYEDMMDYFHRQRPLEEEEQIRANPALTDPNALQVAQGELNGFAQLGRQR